PCGSVFRMVGPSPRDAPALRYGAPERTEVRGARCVVRDDTGGLRGPAPGRPAGRNRGDAGTQRVRLESGGPRGVHERLRARLAHQLRLRGSRGVRLAAAVRPLSDDLLRPRQVARLAGVRRGPGTPA